MCRIERFLIVHPDGFQEPSARLHPCERGTPNIPCDNTTVIQTGQVIAGPSPPHPPPPPPPQFEIIEPRQRDRSERPDSTTRRRGFSDHLRLVFNFPSLFTCKPKPRKREFVLVRRRRGGQSNPEPERPRHHQRAPQPPPPPPDFAPQPWPPIVQVPIHPSPGQMHHHHREPEEMRPRRDERVPIQILEEEQNSPPSMFPPRQHHRPRARTLSPTSRYEEEKRVRLEAERVADALAHERREANLLREERDRAIERIEREVEQRERLQAQWEEQDRRNRAQREEARERRHQAQREAERERRHQAQREAERERRERRHQAQREAERERRERRHQAQREAEQERRRRDRARREAEEQAAMERDRIERLRRARIPRRPRHQPALHQHTRGRGSIDERGERVLDDAIRARTEAEQNQRDRGWYRRPGFEGLRRRGTVAVGERWVNEDDRRRGGRRHWI